MPQRYAAVDQYEQDDTDDARPPFLHKWQLPVKIFPHQPMHLNQPTELFGSLRRQQAKLHSL